LKSVLERPENLRTVATPSSTSLRNFALALTALALLFAKPLFDLVQFARNSTTFEHILLIPFIAAYLAWLRRKTVTQTLGKSSSLALFPFLVGVLLLIGTWAFARTAEVRLPGFMLSFVLLVLAAGFWFLGAGAVRELAFPFALLLFMVPLPPVIMDSLEIFFQHASAMAASGMMKLSGLPAMQEGLFFLLPGFAIEVAQECSGIRSTLILFITSLIAGYLLLRRPRDRVILALSIIPLAILRNGFRIFTLAWLSVEVNPNIIHSDLHHRGGPIFFALSLIPLFLLLFVLRKLEHKRAYAS
jgi:exosortase C (VPDSG-CTERM-specific)